MPGRAGEMGESDRPTIEVAAGAVVAALWEGDQHAARKLLGDWPRADRYRLVDVCRDLARMADDVFLLP
jgi:hypothetical protein